MSSPAAPGADPEPQATPESAGPLRAAMLGIGHFLFKYRNLLFPLLFVPLAAILPPGFLRGDSPVNAALDEVGVLVVIAGLALRALVVGLAYIKRGGKGKKVYADALVTDGIFAHSRNPLYLGNILILLGLALVHGSPWLLLVGFPFLVFCYLCITAAEEEFLARKFGPAYDAYCRSVPRFIPRIRGLGDTIRSMDFDWRRVIEKEYGTHFGAVTGILGLLAWEEVRRHGWRAEIRDVERSLGIWFLALALYVTARLLKKRKILR